MFSRLGLVPIIAAAAIGLAGCEQKPGAPGDKANTVEANTAQSNAAGGEGVPTGGTCGTFPGLLCASRGDFCKEPTGQCGDKEGTGICTKRPVDCPKDRNPVCGCDGTTYDNACLAEAKGVNVRSEGECPKGGGEAATNAAN